jgi:Dyp-type peroxidase family
MANGDLTYTSKPKPPIGKSVQAHLGKASRFADGHTRNWSLFFFFRILPEAELAEDLNRLKAFMTVLNAGASRAAEAKTEGQKLLASIRHSTTMNAGVLAQAKQDTKGKKETKQDEKVPELDAPARLFLDWLKVITGTGATALTDTLRDKLGKAGVPVDVFQPTKARVTTTETGAVAAVPASLDLDGIEEEVDFLNNVSNNVAWLQTVDRDQTMQALEKLWDGLRPMSAMLADAGKFKKAFVKSFGDTPAQAGLTALNGGLLKVCLYELLRQLAPAQWSDPAEAQCPAASRSTAEDKGARLEDRDLPWDPVAINFAFTYSGLEALKLDAATLASFPDAFKEGMAARAERLGDTGPSAPENWEGVLGLDRVHGYFTGGFQVGGSLPKSKHDSDSRPLPVPAKLWQDLRDQVRAYNDRSSDLGQNMRNHIRTYFKLIGMDILHIELGEDPYEVDEAQNVKRLAHRKEHFGFRDGISQPFVDLELGDPAPGGGTPRRNRTWSPLAAGEIYLDQPDEDNNCHKLPVGDLLRRGSTFVVFRKLEQDVAGFRAFLAKQRPGSVEAQRKLAAQFVGRWQNGTPLVLAPDVPLELGDDSEGLLNDYLYAADDPMGQKCPLGAHARRTNPRDIGGTDDVRRHRILRRGIGYGGPLLPDNVLGDGNKRGLLFVAANARIDLQFEVIQANWINRGEFLGQAGLSRCPLTGTNAGGAGDAFLEVGAVAPVTHVPRFVITRGGDYFFAPGMDALKAMSTGCRFKVEEAKLPYQGYSMGDTETPTLFSEERMKEFAARILSGKANVIRVVPPAGSQRDSVAFVGRHKDVKKVLGTYLNADADLEKRKIVNSVDQYRTAVQRISSGQDFIVGTEPGSDTAAKRERLHEILEKAWGALGEPGKVLDRLKSITKRNIEAALRRTGPGRRIDLVHDLASVAVYGVISELFGTPGPTSLTELAVALPFARQHVGEIEPEWLLAASARKPDDPSLATWQIWSILLFADIVGNYTRQPELMALANQAGSEFLNHLGALIVRARASSSMTPEKSTPPNLLAAFVSLEKTFVGKCGYTSVDYYSDVRILLLELVSSAVVIPSTFGSVMATLLDFGINLSELMPVLLADPQFGMAAADATAQKGAEATDATAQKEAKPTNATAKEGKDGVARLVYEAWRLNPSIKLLMRKCMQDVDLPSTGKLKKDDWVAALVATACFDGDPFEQPLRFSLHPFLPGPEREIDDYLLFGTSGDSGTAEGRKICWGRDKLALYLLKECVKAAGRLLRLRRVAGPTGDLRKIAQVNVGLCAHFADVLPDWK